MTQQPTTSTQQPPEEPRPLGDQLKLAGAGVFGLALIIFVLSNLGEVDINFLWLAWHAPLIVALVASAILGALCTLLVSTLRRWRRDRTPRERD